MNENLTALLKAYERPAETEAAIRHGYKQALAAGNRTVVVLDDDPTGIQTVHGVHVYTGWSEETIRAALSSGEPMFFILTNSRALSEAETETQLAEIGRRLAEAAAELGRDLIVICRGDSTLRGHYPLETETLRRSMENVLGEAFDAEILFPLFPEGGRLTAGDIHYVADGTTLVPVGETEFAADRTFGFKASNLAAWVEEKTAGAYAREEVISISLDWLRQNRVAEIRDALIRASGFAKIIVNGLDYLDGMVFVRALLDALDAGKHFLYRTAAAFPKLIGGIGDRPLLSRDEMVTAGDRHGGLVVAGSHVAKTSQQLALLAELPGLALLEFNQHLVLDPPAVSAEVRRVAAAADAAIRAGKTAVVYTRRERLDVRGSREDELRLAVQISARITEIVSEMEVRPAWLIAKGGITSSDIGVRALHVQKALVQGQVLPGVPVWQLGAESRFPGLSYVIFPGNVGPPEALKDVVVSLSRFTGRKSS